MKQDAINHVWKQRKEADREVVANDEVNAGQNQSVEALIKVAAVKKQKSANGESIVKQKMTADAKKQGLERTSGESVMFQAAKIISRNSHELRI